LHWPDWNASQTRSSQFCRRSAAVDATSTTWRLQRHSWSGGLAWTRRRRVGCSRRAVCRLRTCETFTLAAIRRVHTGHRKAPAWCLSVCPVWHILKRTPQGASPTKQPACVSVVLCEVETVVSLSQTTLCPPKTSTFLFFGITLTKINRFNDFWRVKS